MAGWLRGRVTVGPDATGVGRAVVELLRREFGWGDEWRVAKKELAGSVTAALEREELKIAGRMAGERDDLALALALVCWESGRRRRREELPQRDLGIFL